MKVPLSHRFEDFTVDIYNVIEAEGKDAFYVFDCLSELQTAWAKDLMMGYFFRVTCPFLFILDTVAFFPIIRGKHSVQAINKILNTTQLFFDVYADKKTIYVRPEKVWNRNSDTMFLPHTYERVRIEAGIYAKKSFSQIAKELGRSTSSIIREVKQNRIVVKSPQTMGTDCLRME